MIKKLKLQKAVIALILGVIALGVYSVRYMRGIEDNIYALEVAGGLFMVGALMMLYPIVLSKKDTQGTVQLDPEKYMDQEKAEDRETKTS